MKLSVQARIIRMALVSLIGLSAAMSTAMAQSAKPDGAAAGTTFRTKCSGCHGANGGGDTDIGRTLKVPDLRSPEVQKQADAELVDAIANGKNNRMPPFKSSLSPEQIHGLVQYIHQLPKAQ